MFYRIRLCNSNNVDATLLANVQDFCAKVIHINVKWVNTSPNLTPKSTFDTKLLLYKT